MNKDVVTIENLLVARRRLIEESGVPPRYLCGNKTTLDALMGVIVHRTHKPTDPLPIPTTDGSTTLFGMVVIVDPEAPVGTLYMSNDVPGGKRCFRCGIVVQRAYWGLRVRPCCGELVCVECDEALNRSGGGPGRCGGCMGSI